MKTIYLECNMGAAGDMIMGSLLELCDDPKEIIEILNTVGIPGIEVDAEKTAKLGITGTQVVVKVNGEEEKSPV